MEPFHVFFFFFFLDILKQIQTDLNCYERFFKCCFAVKLQKSFLRTAKLHLTFPFLNSNDYLSNMLNSKSVKRTWKYFLKSVGIPLNAAFPPHAPDLY